MALIFLSEASIMALSGALLGILISELLLYIARGVYPAIPFTTPFWAQAGSALIATVTALLFAAIPARKAANMTPVDALLDKKAGQA